MILESYRRLTVITLDNYQKLERILPDVAQQIDMKATGATIHRLKTYETELHAAVWGIQYTTKQDHYLSLANRAQKALEAFGIFIVF